MLGLPGRCAVRRAVFVLAIALPIMYGLEAVGVPHERSGAAFVVLLPLVGLGVAAWGYRDYRRRAALEVVIDRDRIALRVDSRQVDLLPADVASIRLDPTWTGFACILIRTTGKSVRLPPEIAPLAEARDALDVTLIPDLVRRLDERITRGDAVPLRTQPGAISSQWPEVSKRSS